MGGAYLLELGRTETATILIPKNTKLVQNSRPETLTKTPNTRVEVSETEMVLKPKYTILVRNIRNGPEILTKIPDTGTEISETDTILLPKYTKLVRTSRNRS